MRKEFGVLVLFVFLLSFVVAVELTVVSEPNSFSGAILRVKSSGSFGEYGDKIYPSENYGDVGVLKFDVVTSLSEGDLLILFTMDGEIVREVEEGPFDFSNATLTVDLREPFVDVVNDSLGNESVVNDSMAEVVGDEFSEDVTVVTGRTVAGIGSIKYYSVGVVVFLGAILLFFLVRAAYKSGAKYELKALGRMELDKKIDELDD